MAGFIHEASINYDLITGQQIMTTAVVDTFTQNNGKLIVDTDTKWNNGHITSGGASNGSLDSTVVSATSIQGGVYVDGNNVSIIPYTGGSGSGPVPLVLGTGNLTVAAAATTGTFASAQTLPAGTKLYTSTGTYIGTILNAITASTTCTLAAAAQASQAAAAAFSYQLWSQPIIDATWAAGVATLTFASAHGYVQGDWIGVGGLRADGILDGFNGTFEVASAPSGTTLTYTLPVDPGAYFKTLGTNNLTTATANATMTFSAAVTVGEGTVIYGSTGLFIGITSAWISAATAGTGIANNARAQTTVAWYYGTGKCFKYPRCDQTQTYTITNATAATNVATITTSVAHSVILGNSVVITGTTNYNGTFTVTAVTSTTFSYTLGSTPATESTGTVTKTVKSVYLNNWSSWTAVPSVTGVISALGYIKVKSVRNGPFRSGVALTISGLGSASPVATCAGQEQRGWLEVVGAESSTHTIPRVGSFTMNGDWFTPKTMPFTVTSSTAAVGNAVTLTTSTHGLVVGSIVTLSGQSVAVLNGKWVVTTVPSTTTFTITDNSFVGAGASTGGVGFARLTTNNTAQQIVQLPASGGSAVTLTPYAGVWVEKASTFGVISTASWATNVVTFTTTTLGPFIDNLAVGDQFQVLNVTPAAYNGFFTVTGKSYASTTTVTITAAMTNNPGTYTSGGSITADLTVSSATWSGGYVTVTTNKVHGLYAGQVVELDMTTPVAYSGIYEIYDVPSTTTFRIPLSSNPGSFTFGKLLRYEFWAGLGNMVATATAFPTNSEQGKLVHFLSGSGACRFGGDGTNAWGYLPAHGMRIITPNIICSDSTKTATTGVLTQVIPAAMTLTANAVTGTCVRPKLLTGGVIGTISVTCANIPWHLQALQAYTFIYNHVAQCETISFSEIASTFKLNNVGTGISGVASSAVNFNLNTFLCYGGGTISNCTWGKFHNGTSGYYAQVFTDLTNITVKNDSCLIFRTTATAGGTARNATSGSRSLTRVSSSTFTRTRTTGGTNLMTTCSNLIWTDSDYIDTLEGASTATTTQVMFGMTSTTYNIKIDGITFGRNLVANVQPVAGLISALVGSNNIKLRNVGSAQTPLSAGSANPLTYILVGAAGAAAFNITLQRIHLTLVATGLMNAVDNSYSGLVFEDVWLNAATTYTNTPLNTVLKKYGGTNATAGQTAVYGHHWEDMYTQTAVPIVTTTAWTTTNGGQINFVNTGTNGLAAGDQVIISGVVSTASYNMKGGYNGTFTVLASPAPTNTTFSVASPQNPGVWASGGTVSPVMGKIVLQMNEKTSIEPSASSYTINQLDDGSGFTSVGTLALLNVADEIEWVTPYWLYGHKRFTNGATAPYTMAAPTLTATNPINHDLFYDLDKGSGFSGTWKNLYFKGSNVTTAFAAYTGWTISGTTTVTLTPQTATCVGSISGNVLTITSVSAGKLYVGYTLVGTGISANTIITRVIDAKLGKAGTYEVSTIAFPGGTSNPTISATSQTVTSTTITGSSSTYGINYGDNVFDITTAANIPAAATVASITSSTVFTLSAAGTNAASQALAFSSLHSETSIVPATGFKMKLKVKINTYAATNLLTTIAIPTVVSGTNLLVQYPLDTVNLTFTSLKAGSEVRCYTGTDPISAVEIGGVESSGTSFSFSHSSGGVSGYIQILATGYQNITLPFTYSTSDQSIPIQQQLDRQYQNL